MAEMTDPDPPILQWLIDVRTLWPTQTTSASPKAQMQEFQRTASTALARLPPPERTRVLAFVYPKDARLALASHLLKHAVAVRRTGVSWKDSEIGRDARGKPTFTIKGHSSDASIGSSSKPFDFNVSHQAGLVSLIAGSVPEQDVGTDVVCVNERLDRVHATIEQEGWDSWVDMHAEVFAPDEVRSMKGGADWLNLDVDMDDDATRLAVDRCMRRGKTITMIITAEGTGGERTTRALHTDGVIDAKLRRFYAYWALREAYVKMTGDALLAEWLTRLEFRNVRAPLPCADAGELDLLPGEVVDDFEIWFEGRRVLDVAMELRAVGRHYMIASAVRMVQGQGVAFGAYKELDIEMDVMSVAKP